MDLLDKARRAKRESKYIEFKSEFDPESNEHWCETLKDIVAIANSGGGVIIFGVDNRGRPLDRDISPVLALDPSAISDKIYRYTGINFSGFEILEHAATERVVAMLRIEAADVPMVFTRPGTYQVQDGPKQKTAFSQGSVYFRHGAKSEPGNSEDIRSVIERNLETTRREWLRGMRKVVAAPRGSVITASPTAVAESPSQPATHIRLVDDPTAPGFRRMDPDETHPYRQKELIKEVNQQLPRGSSINPYDVTVVRRQYQIDSIDEYFYKSKFGSPQYSDECVKWFVNRYLEDPQFFLKARQEHYRDTH